MPLAILASRRACPDGFLERAARACPALLLGLVAACASPPDAAAPRAADAAAERREVPAATTAADAARAPESASRAQEVTPAVVQPERQARIWVISGLEPVRREPSWKSVVIGLMRAGQSVGLRSPAPLVEKGSGCPDGYYEVEPRGYVCSHATTTLDGGDLRVRAAALALPDTESALPFHVGVSVGAPIYRRIPTLAEQRAAEPGLDAHLAELPAADPSRGGAIDSTPANRPPPDDLVRYLGEVRSPLLADEDAFQGMKVSWTLEFDAEGRTWLYTADMGLVPKDKVRTAPPPTLSGIGLGPGKGELPIAFLWLDDAPKLTRGAGGVLVETGESWPRHSYVPVTGKVLRARGGSVLETREGLYLRAALATVITRAGRLPRGVRERDRWISVRVTRGYLVAYEGLSPVYATAISPGVDASNMARRYSTPSGLYNVYWKALSWDMAGVDAGGNDWLVDEVPWVAFYHKSYALHGAWWHDDFGRPKSHGCVNLPPAAAHELFGWIEPAVPEGWYLAAALPGQVRGTVVDVRP